MRPGSAVVAPAASLASALGLDALVSCLTRFALKRWRYCLIVFLLVAIPVMVLQWFMLEEERAKQSGASIFRMDAPHDLFARNWATSGAVPELLSRALRYCNMPVSIGAEGPDKLNNSLSGLRLLAVYTVVRHGDRAPLLEYPNFRYKLGCDIRVLKQRRDDLLNRMVDTLLHTAPVTSGPFARRLPFPNETRCGRGRMTPQGVLQNFLLGNHFAHAYRQLLDDLGPTDLRLHVTHSDRTFHSAVALSQALLRGISLAPPQPAVAANVAFCDPRQHLCACPKLRLYFAETKAALARIVTAREIASLRFAFGEFLGAAGDQPPNLEDLLDATMPLVCHRFREPMCVEARCLTHRMVHELWRAHDRVGQSLARELSVIRFCKLAMFPFLQTLANHMREAGKSREPKMVIYAGHDLTVRYLLTALGLYDGSWPPLASRVVWEVYADADRRYFRLLYNGEVMTNVLPFCREEVCPLNKLTRFLKEDFWLAFGTSKPCM